MVIKLQTKLLSAVAACAAGAYTYYATIDEKKVFNSWTTNYTPSVAWDWNWDKRSASSMMKPSKESKDANNNVIDIEKQPLDDNCSKARRHLILIRHGQYNMKGVTDADRSLSKLGQEQAALTGERLKAMSLPYNRFVYSTMTRATETANIIIKHLDIEEEVEKCDMLREGAPVPPEPPIGNWKPELYFYTDGSRIEAAFRKYFHRAPVSQTEDSYEIFVCHANVIRYFVCRGLQLPPEAWLRLSLHNGSMTYMVINPDGRVSLRCLGECGYMAPEKLSRT